MDLDGLDAREVMRSLPQVGKKRAMYGLTYGLTWVRGSGGMDYQPADLVGLTVAGLYQAGAVDLVEAFLQVLQLASRKLRTFQPDPEKVVTLELTSQEVLIELSGDQNAPVITAQELYELLDHEPAMWYGSRGISADGAWRWEITRAMRPYTNVQNIEQYVEVVTRLAEESAQQVAQLVPFAQAISPAIEEEAPPAVYGSNVPGREPQFFAPSVPLLGSGIDTELWEFVRPLVENGRWEQVAREAAAFVETRARDWTGSKREVLDLMSELLAPPKKTGSPDREVAAERGEQEGWYLLTRGFFLAIRNHVMHNSVGTEEELQYGLGALGTASLLIRRIREAVSDSPDN
jgi:hypothetical protein